jgi:two-component system capsular synthesis sensor histidine kinase RcsC
MPYRGHADTLESEDAVLVQAWPPSAQEPRWKHGRVRVLAPGSSRDSLVSAVAKAGITSTFNPASIGRAVRMAQDGIERPALGQAHAQRISLGLRVMVVEDNVISQIILREQLEHLGCAATMLSNGTEALRHWDALDHDVVITDLNMPLMGGYELARSLRKLGYTGAILGLTASAAPEATRLGLDAGMDQVLLKPLPILVLAQTLHDLAEDLN